MGRNANAWLARVRGERHAGSYAFDLAFVHTDRALHDGRYKAGRAGTAT